MEKDGRWFVEICLGLKLNRNSDSATESSRIYVERRTLILNLNHDD